MFVVKYCVVDYKDTWETTVAEFDTEEEANAYADKADAASPFSDMYHKVVEE